MKERKSGGVSWYAQQLRDPRWQKKRLEILERDNWECLNCGNKEKTLHVHHRRYISGCKPWEYEGADLATLCEICHRLRTGIDRELSDISGQLCLEDAATLVGYARGRIAYSEAWDDVPDGHVEVGGGAEEVSNAIIWGVAHAWGIDNPNMGMTGAIKGGRISYESLRQLEIEQGHRETQAWADEEVGFRLRTEPKEQ